MLLNGEDRLSEEYRNAILMYQSMGVNSVLIGCQYPDYDLKEAVGSPNCLSIPIVGVDGKVFPCCGGAETLSLGNLFSDNAEDVFAGEVMFDFYNGLKRRCGKKLPKDCQGCIYNGQPRKKYRTFDLRGNLDYAYYNKGYRDFRNQVHKKKTYAVGANEVASEFLKACREDGIQVEAVVDNDYLKWGSELQGIPVIPPKEALNNQVYVGCIRSANVCDDIMGKWEGNKYLYAMFLEQFAEANPIFSYSYLLN